MLQHALSPCHSLRGRVSPDLAGPKLNIIPNAFLLFCFCFVPLFIVVSQQGK
jgi:hypothetical protein